MTEPKNDPDNVLLFSAKQIAAALHDYIEKHRLVNDGHYALTQFEYVVSTDDITVKAKFWRTVTP